MLGLHSPVRIVASLTVFTFSLFTVGLASAQTPAVAGEKPVAELSAPVVTAAPESEVELLKAETVPATTVAPAPVMQQCTRTVKAEVVAIPQPIMLNRLGATIPNAFVFALKADTITSNNQLQLRPGRRPRPIVLRANVGDCLRIFFTNAVPQAAFDSSTPNSPKVGTREVSLHIQGQEWTAGAQDDGSFVGKNSSSLASPAPSPSPLPSPMPPQTQTYNLFVRNEGTFLLYTMGDTEAEPTGQLSRGLFGALNVQPTGAEWYRSQVSQQDLALATKKNSNGTPLRTRDGQPVIDYNAVYPTGSRYPDGTPIPANTPILKMLDSNMNIVHSDLTAIITAPGAGCRALAQFGSGVWPVSPSCAAVHSTGGGGAVFGTGGAAGGVVNAGSTLEFAGRSTSIAGSPTDHALRKNSSNLQSTHPPIGPTPMRLA